MANINDILNDARIKGCSDVHIGENNIETRWKTY